MANKLFGLFLLSVFLISCEDNSTAPSVNQTTPSTVTSENIDPSVTVQPQTIDNSTVTVAEVDAPESGWIVIHQSTDDGSVKVPESIGQTKVEPGTNTDVVVELSQDVAPGEKLWAMLHTDEGEVGTYEFPGADKPVKVNEQIVQQPFAIQ